MAQLDEGAVMDIHNGNASGTPRMQIIDVKKIAGAAGSGGRYRLVISDGRHLTQVIKSSRASGQVPACLHAGVSESATDSARHARLATGSCRATGSLLAFSAAARL